MTGARASFLGWLADPGPPFREPVLVPYLERPIILIGPNGYGKTRLLRSLVDRHTARLFSSLPRRLAPYLTLARRRIEDRRRPHDLSDKELFEAAEATRAQDDDEAWWCAHLDRPDLWWTVRLAHNGAVIGAVSPDDPFNELVRLPAGSRHAALTVEPWVNPDAEDPAGLDRAVARAFRDWAAHVLSDATLYANPLVATRADGEAISLLTLATAYCTLLAERTTARLRRLAGFPLELSCRPAEDFAWHVRVAGEWIPVAHTSRAMSRWCTLAATETLRELSQCVAEVAGDAIRTSDEAALAGTIDPVFVPPGVPGPFATRSTWVAMDEPEVHLFASEARVLADALAGRGSDGRTLVATHSLEFAARFVGIGDFLVFDEPGHFSLDRPERGIGTLLTTLASHGPGILAGTRVLYVEGDWDVELLERLYGPRLAAANVLLSRMHGVKGAGVAATSVWQRMMSTPFGMVFDAVRGDAAQRQWNELLAAVATGGRHVALRQLRAAIRTARDARHEDVELIRLFHAVIDGGLENRLRLVMHGLSDVFQVVHPKVYGVTALSWQEAGYDGTIGFKEFCRRVASVDLGDGRQCRRILDAFDEAGRPVEAEAAAALSRAIDGFLDG
ncbi:hypothetical protein [Luedemannella helvata]|uniref:AAA+ ATPase domain-containing protein n=1 Tax=Luedemannella helvata TaxID=349315 RepID=A0ABP4WAC0_9ACTN